MTMGRGRAKNKTKMFLRMTPAISVLILLQGAPGEIRYHNIACAALIVHISITARYVVPREHPDLKVMILNRFIIIVSTVRAHTDLKRSSVIHDIMQH
jgi:hypothetical protein